MRRHMSRLGAPSHLGLAYNSWAPVDATGKIPNATRAGWLEELQSSSAPEDYAVSFVTWKASFRQPGDQVWELSLASRLLIGHGTTSATDVGLVVHHTWGVPVIPGSALKGLAAHYTASVYGPSDPSLAPWDQPADDERDRASFQGSIWKGDTVQRGPGEMFRLLFGAPEAQEDEMLRQRGLGAGATTGQVQFHDALYVPGTGAEKEKPKPFAVDVMTPHQVGYYRYAGAAWPTDYDDPNPVPFLTVRPGVTMLFALSGPADATDLARRILTEALSSWGVGGKTSSGYGRFTTPSESEGSSRGPHHRRGERIRVVRVEDPAGRGKVKFQADDGILGHFVAETEPDVPIGEALEVWVANVNAQTYTLTLREPKGRKR